MKYKIGNVPWIKGKKLNYIPRPKMIGRIPWNKNKKCPNLSKKLKGRTFSDETIKKMKISHIGKKPMLGKKHSIESKQKMRNTHLGKKHSLKSRLKMKESFKGISRNKGIKKSKETKIKMSESQTKRWDKIGRKKYKRYIHNRDKKYLQWRSDIFMRDGWTCQTCNKKGCYLEAHHIKSWAKYPKLRYILDNGITLCLDCHKLTNNYKNQKYD